MEKETFVLYDGAGTTFEVPPNFIDDAVRFAWKYIQDKEVVDALVENFTARKEKRASTTPQDLFNLACDAFIEADKHGEYIISGENLMYEDVPLQLRRDVRSGRKPILLTSGTPQYIQRFLDFQLDGIRFQNYFHEVWSGEEVGDKDDPKTYSELWEKTKGGIYALFDDKISVCRAASEGFGSEGGSPLVFLVDRKEKHSANKELSDLLARGVRKIVNFTEI